MSYNPPRKSAYGDELVDDDNWSQKNNLSSPPSTAQPINYDLQQGARSTANQPLNPNPASINTSISGLPAITPEDMLFIRSWQHDSYIQRGKYPIYLYHRFRLNINLHYLSSQLFPSLLSVSVHIIFITKVGNCHKNLAVTWVSVPCVMLLDVSRIKVN